MIALTILNIEWHLIKKSFMLSYIFCKMHTVELCKSANRRRNRHTVHIFGTYFFDGRNNKQYS